VRPIKRAEDGFVKQIRKHDTVWYGRFGQRNRLRLGKSRLVTS
jgi:hypothetical protein